MSKLIIPKTIIGIRSHVATMIQFRNGRRVYSFTKNLVTDAGDNYYTMLGAISAPKWNILSGGCKLGTSSTTPTKSDTDVNTYITGTYTQLLPGYPCANDTDPGNPYNGNANYLTYKYYWNYEQANGYTIREGAIVDQELTPNMALCHFLVSPVVPKTSEMTFYIWVNHEFLGSS